MLKEEQLKQLNNDLADLGSRVALLEAAYSITALEVHGDDGIKIVAAQLKEIRSHLQMLGMPCKGSNIITSLENGPSEHNGATMRS